LDALDDEFAFLALSVERAVAVQEPTAQHFLDVSQSRGGALARRFLRKYAAIREDVAYSRAAYEELDDEKLKRGAITEMRTLVGRVREDLQRGLGWLDAARDPVLDVGTHYLLDFLACRLVDSKADVTVVTTADGSYSIDAGVLLEADGSDDDGVPIVVFIPRRERESGLLHPLIVHELGHAVSRLHGIAEQVLAAADDDVDATAARSAAVQSVATEMERVTSFRERVSAIVGTDVDADDEDKVTAVAEEYLTMLAGACLEEAICDAFAIQLLGPTYLYAFVAILGTSDLDKVDPVHPAARQRMALMLDQLDAVGWGDVLTEETPELADWFRAEAEKSGPPLTRELAFCSRVVTAMAPSVRELVGQHVGSQSFTPASFPAQLRREIHDLLAVKVPPSQVQRSPTDRQTIGRAEIILGSWIYAIQEAGDGLGAIAKAPGQPELSLLLPKALELSALLEAWEEAA
jgi:hypothetical protein